MTELRGEKIDVVPWSGRSSHVRRRTPSAGQGEGGAGRRPGTQTALVIVPDYQLSLAIGKEGQNARLAARLTGWRIDIKSETQFGGGEQRRSSPAGRAGREPRRHRGAGGSPRRRRADEAPAARARSSGRRGAHRRDRREAARLPRRARRPQGAGAHVRRLPGRGAETELPDRRRPRWTASSSTRAVGRRGAEPTCIGAAARRRGARRGARSEARCARQRARTQPLGLEARHRRGAAGLRVHELAKELGVTSKETARVTEGDGHRGPDGVVLGARPGRARLRASGGKAVPEAKIREASGEEPLAEAPVAAEEADPPRRSSRPRRGARRPAPDVPAPRSHPPRPGGGRPAARPELRGRDPRASRS